MKRLFYILFALIILIMSWEHQKSSAAIVDSTIPQDSIRLRIIANSDSPKDQWLKREIRDKVVDEINKWVGELDDLESARQIIESHLPQINQIVKNTILDNGFTYDTSIKLGMVSFPTKMYGSYVYPAGEYEALRITVGQGLGQNWWCVLFPPLCFVDMSNGDAVQNQDEDQKNESRQQETEQSVGGTVASAEKSQPEVRFFLFDFFKKLWSYFT